MHTFSVFHSGKSVSAGIYTVMPGKKSHSLIVLREHLYLLVQIFYSFNRNNFLLMRRHFNYIFAK